MAVSDSKFVVTAMFDVNLKRKYHFLENIENIQKTLHGLKQDIFPIKPKECYMFAKALRK